MTTQEFSNGFDTQIAAYNSGYLNGDAFTQAAFDEYEKSWFLTKAQKELVIAYYNGTLKASFEETEELRRYLSGLVKSDTPVEATTDVVPVSDDSKFYKLPDDLLFITFEQIQLSTDDCKNGSYINVIPVTQDDYFRISRNPFRQSNERKALRLDIGDNMVEIVSKYDGTYSIRYVSNPDPIILVELEDMTIEGKSDITECKLNQALHQRILDSAVSLAIASKSGDAK